LELIALSSFGLRENGDVIPRCADRAPGRSRASEELAGR
jgi:hypothetical protein